MKKKRVIKARGRSTAAPWLPIDSRLLPPLFSFGRVRGVARWFLVVEMTFATLVVIGTLLLFVLTRGV
jgi:hypothetical protein